MGVNSSPAYESNSQTGHLTDCLINHICDLSPTVKMVLNKQGMSTMRRYITNIVPRPVDSYQSSKALHKAIYDYVKPLLGKKIAKRTIEDVTTLPFVLTANHHGVDFFAQSVQGTLIFGSRQTETGKSLSTIPVFACGNIPLNNLTYPRGMLVYDLQNVPTERIPARIPLFPDRLKRKMVSCVEHFDQSMVDRTLQGIHKMTTKGELSDSVSNTLVELLTQDYAAPEVLNQERYSQQAVILNNRVWKRMFAETNIPDLVYLEIEKIVAEVLYSDLQNENSLFQLLSFNSKILQKLLNVLDGVRVCWKRDNLRRRLLEGDPRRLNANSCGTCFFWGIDDHGMRVPLLIIPQEGLQKMLVGVDDKGKKYEFLFNPDALSEALKNEQILPSLFTCYTVLSLARGIVCAGGYYQAEYLPQVQNGVASALEEVSDLQIAALKVRSVPTKAYLSGMQAVMVRGNDDVLVPAGPIETIAGGGLTSADMETIMNLSVRKAHIASLFETIKDMPMDSTWINDQKQELSQECGKMFKDDVVIK